MSVHLTHGCAPHTWVCTSYMDVCLPHGRVQSTRVGLGLMLKNSGQTRMSRHRLMKMRSKDEGYIYIYNMRTDIAFGRNMAITTSCDLEIGITSGFLHGYDFTDRRQMKDFLEINARFIGHPMVLVGLFTELQYQRRQSIHERLLAKYLEKSIDAQVHISSINASHSGVGEHVKITQDVLGIVEKVFRLDLSSLPRCLNILMESAEDIGKSVQDTDARKYGAKGRDYLWHAGQKQNAAEASLQIRLLAAVGGVR